MVAMTHLHEMRYSETRLSVEIVELMKHSKIYSDVNSQFIIDK